MEVKEAVEGGTIIIVPVGSTEQHGPHLPLDTDARLATEVAELAAGRAHAEGVRVLVAPAISVGYSPHHSRFAGTLTLDAETFLRVVEAIAQSLWSHGFRKILFLNGHGGNTSLLGVAVQALRAEHGIHVAAANYWAFAAESLSTWRKSGPGGINHACEMETSLLLAMDEELVRKDWAEDTTWNPRSDFLIYDYGFASPVMVSWDVRSLTSEGALGNGAVATAERGQALVDIVVTRLVQFLEEFVGWDWDDPRSL
jgi:creatinine amidohydrolase